jgi:hypothetical protein
VYSQTTANTCNSNFSKLMSGLRKPDYDLEYESLQSVANMKANSENDEAARSLLVWREEPARYRSIQGDVPVVPDGIEVSRVLHTTAKSWMSSIEEDSFAPMTTSQYNTFAMDRIIRNPSLVPTGFRKSSEFDMIEVRMYDRICGDTIFMLIALGGEGEDVWWQGYTRRRI